MAGFALCATTPMLPDVTPPLTPKSSSACDNVYTAAAPCLLLRAPLVSPSVRYFRKYSGTYVPRHEKAEHTGDKAGIYFDFAGNRSYISRHVTRFRPGKLRI